MVCRLSWLLTYTKLRPRLILNFWRTLRILNSIVRTEVYHHTCINWTIICEELRLCYKYVISRISNYWLQYIEFFYVSVNYLKYIFTSKIKKIEIVIYVHQNMIWTSFQMYPRDLLQNKVTRLDFVFFGYGVHTLQ